MPPRVAPVGSPPWASETLCLCVEFDLSDVPAETRARMREVDHDAALRRAIARTTLFDDAERSRTITGKARHRVVETSASASLRATHGAEFDAWARARDAHVSVDYVYAATGDGLGARVLTKLGACDGVTALRVALHALEIVEGGNEAMTESAFKKNPTYRYGARQAFNFVRRVLFETAVDLVGYKLGLGYGRKNARQAPEYDGVRAPNTPKALFDLYAEGEAPACEYRVYRPEHPKGFHRLIAALKEWERVAGLRGYFCLLNFSPRAVPAYLTSADDLRGDIRARYREAFDNIAAPPTGPIWDVQTPFLLRKIFVNNYGRHSHSFRAKLRGFVWDWLRVPATCRGAGCVEINGEFCVWTRGLDLNQPCVRDSLERHLGRPFDSFHQNASWEPLEDYDPFPGADA